MVTANLVSKDKHSTLMALLGQTSEQKKGMGSQTLWMTETEKKWDMDPPFPQ